MLQIQHICKEYRTGNLIQKALDDVSLNLRDNEFVAILGPSGSGKTTLLNIIGGLDRYDSGDLIINGISTKKYKDRDWDSYRNHTIGFVFQSYNLIPHQTVLANVELALTISGIGKSERRKRATEALEKVGLGAQIHKRPSQMSGGQMQRVAIARALVNDPDILLADEPTGALDSDTSVQVMDLLQEVAKDRLVVMVTHNPDLAKQYSTRIIRLLDGEIQSDSDPVSEQEKIDVSQENLAKPSMSFKTALSLSLNNLMTKKGRTFLTSFAGSIGIIGIALILSLSNGVQTYINTVENDTMASYPIEIQDNSMDMSAMMSAMMEMHSDESVNDTDNITSRPYVNDILNSLSSEESNNLTAFKEYLDSKEGKEFVKNTKAIEYDYSITPLIYNDNGDKGLIQVSPNGLLERLGFSDMMSLQNQFMSSSTTMANNEVWTKLPTSSVLRDEEYELVNGEWANDYNEVVLAVDENNQITDYALYSLGLMDQDELVNNYNQLLNGNIEKIETSDTVSYTPEEILNMSFKLVLPSDLYRESNGVWIDQSDDEEFVQNVVDNALEVKVVGIIKPKDSSVKRMTMGGVMYTDDMQDYIIEQSSQSEIAKQQIDNPNTNVFTGQSFDEQDELSLSNLTDEQRMMMASMSESELMQYMASYNENVNATYESNLSKIGVVDTDSPTAISIYASSFEQKELISDMINDYNEEQKLNGEMADVITYNDFIGMMLESVSTVINMISYVLIGFVSVSLIVSSIMIGIITYISVLERTKEIGILRAIGASKKDISRVFNAETFIEGLISGVLGIVITLILNFPISTIVEHYTGVANIAILPWQGGIILVLISLLLTIIAGLIPSKYASKKDPVEALRSE